MRITYFEDKHEFNLNVDYSKMMAPSWTRRLKEFLHTKDMSDLMFSVAKMYDNKNMAVFPKKNQIFNMFSKMDISEINVAIINCDPKFNRRSNGIAFANEGRDGDYDLSLVNLFSKISTYERRVAAPSDFTLQHWIEQYVFLFNISCTGFSTHYQRALWFGFTRAVLDTISRNRQGIIFLFVGDESQCRPYINMVSHAKHTILRHDTLTYDALNEINLEIDGINGKSHRIKW